VSGTIIECPSPNHGERAPGPIDILLLHYTGMPDAEAALARLRDPESEVSSHYFVFEDGRIAALVPEELRAWHAGIASWGGAADINSRSIGIEIANAGHPGGMPPYPAAQIAALTELCRAIVGRHPIPPHRVLGHSDVAPGRKLDPGETFPWAALAAEGIGLWTEPPLPGEAWLQRGDAGSEVEALQGLLALYGYGVGVNGRYGKRTENVVAALQRHFRPARVDGRADTGTLATLRQMLDALP
jgi:N-acetylmuramoyl-L-alanine amidase